MTSRIKEKLIQSLDHLFDVNKASLGIDFSTKNKFLKELIFAKKIPGIYFSLNSLLLEATLNNTLPSIIPYVSHFFKTPSFDEEFHYANYGDYVVYKISPLIKKYILFDLPSKSDIYASSKEKMEKTKLLLQKSLNLIKISHEEYYKEIIQFISEFLILKTEAIKAGSSFDLFGMMFVNNQNAEKSVINMMDLLIHETAHFYLYSICIEDPLVLNDYQERYFSPIKGRARPMLGVYHATFILARVLNFIRHFRTLLDSSQTLSKEHNRQEIDALIHHYQNMAEESLKTVIKSAKLTELGRDLIYSAQDLIFPPSKVSY